MRTTLDLTRAQWVKSTYSNGNGGGCVEWAPTHGHLIPVRDSKNPAGPALLLAPAAWAAFVAYAARHAG
ncbi:DUF397 domain-containing protein [Streptomyces liangshanensis]|uniref:DUF397 domain-containing protein n=1 Tax=Streptomyces liangshanensis TaxID=2717324 RepID=A0A6G9GZN3_9ACTN|nr:DUF397 domain-containing protein [Streptomyces liangshanensis]QIQ03705.1 DUF397 domain-containing protein [Streptomyces liangshanensis]